MCCGPVLDDPTRAMTAEALMQSRYTANVLHRWNHLWVTWHPRTRPEHVEPVGQPPRWAGLEILAVHDGSPDDTTGVVEFRACLLYTSPSPRDRTRSRMPSSA